MNATDLAYAAGVMDSDGSISIRVSRRGANAEYHFAVAKVGQCDPVVVYWLKEMFGGSVQVSERRGSIFYDWVVASRLAAAFLQQVLPYLKIKRAQAELAVSLHPQAKGRRRAIESAELDRRREARAQVLALNARTSIGKK